jgi:glycosyltransferase involved in cell wall biosynthesis
VEEGQLLIPALIELETWVYEQADGFLACGPAIVEQIRHDYGVEVPDERLGIVAHGLPDASAGVEEVPPGRTPRLLFVGRLEARKGIDTILEAAALLHDGGVDFELVIVGDDSLVGPDGLTYRQAFERDHPDVVAAVTFAGRVDDGDLRAAYAACDVFVTPSRFESFGLILLEAMMFAKPVVVADIGGLAEIVEDGVTGVLVPPDDPAAWATALRGLLESPERRRTIGAQGKQAYRERFSVERMSAGAEAFYRALVAARQPAALSAG